MKRIENDVVAFTDCEVCGKPQFKETGCFFEIQPPSHCKIPANLNGCVDFPMQERKMSLFSGLISQIVETIERMKLERRALDYDIFATFEELTPKLPAHPAIESFAAPIATEVFQSHCNDCFVRIVQVGFGSTEMLLDIPNTSISPHEAAVLIRTRRGFEFEQTWSGIPSAFNPLQKSYPHGCESQLAADIVQIFVELWRYSAETPLKIPI